MLAPLAGTLTITQLFASMRGGFAEAYTATHDGSIYHCVAHAGIDLRAPLGTPVLAMKGGIIHFYGPSWGFPDDGYGPLGLHGVVTLPSGEEHWYAHLSAALAADGGTVGAGSMIARSGYTGNVLPPGAQGAHLHVAWRPYPIRYDNGFDAFADFLTHFDATVWQHLDFSLV